MKNKQIIKACILLLIFSAKIATLYSCSLAIHDWKLRFFVKIPLSAPLFPASEFSMMLMGMKEQAADTILWVANHTPLSSFLANFVHKLPGWPSKSDWYFINNKKSVLSLARSLSKKKNPPVIIGSDKNYLKIAFFSDANSSFKCHQLVVVQTSRIRGVYANSSAPWAQEMNGMSWLSLIFFQIPLPGSIMSFSGFPTQGLRASIFEDHAYVENLLTEKLLKRRPDLEIDPYSFDFPELPE